MGSTLTKPFHKNKNQFLLKMLENSSGEKPMFRYILSNEEMISLIAKTSAMNKKNIEQLNLLLYTEDEEILV